MSWQGNLTQEQQVVRAFLAMPPCPVKEALGRLVLQVAFQVENLRCAQAQADGLPCQELEPDCSACQGLEERLRRCLEAEAFSA